MATVTRTVSYRCSDDCQMAGCPGHTGTLTYRSVTDSYTFDMAGRELEFERGQLEAMLVLLRDLSSDRIDALEVR